MSALTGSTGLCTDQPGELNPVILHSLHVRQSLCLTFSYSTY